MVRYSETASYDSTTNKCLLSKETRHMNPYGFKADLSSDYMENMCLKREYSSNYKLLTYDFVCVTGSSMCTSAAFISDTNRELDGNFERVSLVCFVYKMFDICFCLFV